jgi:DNA replication protein DnaC
MSYSPFKTGISNYSADGFLPTEEQLEAARHIRRFLNSNEKIFVLKGYAGTGKTTLVNFILKDYYMKGKLIAVSAFTNKATNVISRKTPFAQGITLYKLLLGKK